MSKLKSIKIVLLEVLKEYPELIDVKRSAELIETCYGWSHGLHSRSSYDRVARLYRNNRNSPYYSPDNKEEGMKREVRTRKEFIAQSLF